jgi:hypothetical protein
MRSLLVCLALSWTLWGCTGSVPAGGSGAGPSAPDAGPTDAGAVPDTDGGATLPDAGMPVPSDAGSTRPDAGHPVDAGAPPPPDAGIPPPDAGTPQPDAGVVTFDLGETRWTPLFDASLSRFYKWLPSKGRNNDPEGVFRMEGDVLHLLGIPANGLPKDFGYLATWEYFGDVRVHVEQKWGTAKYPPRLNQPRDSGLLYSMRGPDQIWPQCLEFQIIEHNVGDTWMLSGTGLTTSVAVVGATPPVFAPLGSPEHLRGGQLVRSLERESLTDWNWLDLYASGHDSANVVNGWWVNGATDIEADLGGGTWASLSSGRLALQAEGAEVFYRNMVVRPLRYMAPPPGAVVLFDGSNLDAWQSSGGGAARWRLVDGAMEVVPGMGDLHTRSTFGDVRVHVEFKVPPSSANAAEQDRGNSGVYLQGRYEVQILDSFGSTLADANDCGAIYGVRDAAVNEAFPPGIWQSYDILFRAARWSGSTRVAPARITVVWNGSVVQRDVEIPGSTTLGDPEGPQPAPLRLQDHGHAVRFRNIWLQPL